MTNVVVIGQASVGLPMALRVAEVGLRVVGLDHDTFLVDELNAGHSRIVHVANTDLLAGLRSGYSASTDPECIAEANAVLVCVPTPLRANGGPDLRAVVDAATIIGRYVKRGTLVVLESTTYPGTTDELFAPLVLGDRWQLRDIHIAFSPERIDPGNADFGVRNTPKVVGGSTPEATETAREFYSRFVDVVVVARGTREAEMSKLLENTFRQVNIALVNEMARFSHELGIDLWNAIDCAATKPFGYLAFRPGPGVGGHCIPVDPAYLSHRVQSELGYPFRMADLAAEINEATPHYVAQRTRRALERRDVSITHAEVLLLGVTYKPDVADCRGTPAAGIASQLAEWGATISYRDPYVPEWTFDSDDQNGLTSATDPYAAAAASDAAVLLQPHRSYNLGVLAATASLLIDTRGVVTRGQDVERL